MSYLNCGPNVEDTFTYNMNHSNRGDFFIFVHKYFESSNLSDREGADLELDRLRHIATTLSFKEQNIHVCKDYTDEEIKSKILTWKTEDHTDDDCVAVAVLTHGWENFLAAKNAYYHIANLWEWLSNEKFNGKPKIVILQACRGDMVEEGIRASEEDDPDGSDRRQVGKTSQYVYGNVYPEEPDFLVAFCTFIHHKAMRGWFMEALYGYQSYMDTKDILSILQAVTAKIAEKQGIIEKDGQELYLKQCPETYSTLRSEVYFTRK